MQRIIGHLIAASQIMRNFLPQLLQTGIGGVKGTSLFQRINALVADVPRSIEVRLADTQRNRILHFADNIEKFPNSGRFNRNDCIRKGISHGVIISL